MYSPKSISISYVEINVFGKLLLKSMEEMGYSQWIFIMIFDKCFYGKKNKKDE